MIKAIHERARHAGLTEPNAVHRALKGIVLAGGSGTRLYPTTRGLSKQLLPIYDKPMIYYSLSVLMLAGIRDILLISTPEFLPLYRNLLGDGDQLGISITYLPQPRPDGLPQAFVIGSDFIGRDRVALVLGDNLFVGARMRDLLLDVAARRDGATIFAYRVDDPERYGVITFDGRDRATEIVEKPANPASSWAVTGLYFYDNDVIDMSRGLSPSARGEYEITDLNRAYLAQGRLKVERLGRGYAWLDTGTFDSLLEAAEFVRVLQKRQGMQIACLEEIAYLNGFIDLPALERRALDFDKTSYGRYLAQIAEEYRQARKP